MYFDLKQYTDEFVNCPWCGQDTKLEFVRGHYECISCKRTGSTGRGIPDVNLCYNGVEIWVELKIVSGRKVNITAEQCAWHYRRIRAGGRTFIIARDKVDKVRKGKYDKIYVWTGENAVSVQENGIIAENSYIYETPFDWEQIIAKLFM